MHFLYADESGKIPDPAQEHFVLAGVSVFEREVYWVSKKLDKIAEQFMTADKDYVELHASPMFQRRRHWRQFNFKQRTDAIKEALGVIDGRRIRIFASVVRKSEIKQESGNPENDILDHSFIQLISRFDMFLTRGNKEYGNPQRGLVVFDKETAKELRTQRLVESFRTTGHKWGKLRNMAEVPMFVDSKATRLVQLADLVAYAIFRNFEKGDGQFFSIIEDKFDYHKGKSHGLYKKV